MNAPFLPRVLRHISNAPRRICTSATPRSDRAARRRQGRRRAHGARRADPRRAPPARSCHRAEARRHDRVAAGGRVLAAPSAPSHCRSRRQPRAPAGAPRRRAERELTVIGIDLVPWLVGELAAFADDHPLFDVLMIDETSRLKDPSGKRARALLKVAGRFRTRWGLTGTPRPNSSQDLFMPAAIITDGALWGRAFVPWQKRHFRPRDPFGREWAALPGAEEQIAADFGTRRDDGRRRGHARPAAAQHRGDAAQAAGRRDGDLPRDGAGAVRHDRRALDRGRLAADRDRQAGAAGQRLPLRRRQRRSGRRAHD